MNSRTEEAVGLSSLKAELLNYSKFDLAFLLDEAGPTPPRSLAIFWAQGTSFNRNVLL